MREKSAKYLAAQEWVAAEKLWSMVCIVTLLRNTKVDTINSSLESPSRPAVACGCAVYAVVWRLRDAAGARRGSHRDRVPPRPTGHGTSLWALYHTSDHSELY